MEEHAVKSQNAQNCQYKIGTVYSREYLQSMSNESQRNHSLVLLVKNHRKEIQLVCSRHISLNCMYSLTFSKERDVNNSEGYQLIEKCITHNQKCSQISEKNQFLRARAQINNLKNKIIEIICERQFQFGYESPKKLLSILAQKIGKNQNFIYEGITNKHLRRLIKKKFDNKISEVKRLINPSLFKTKSKSKTKRSSTKTQDVKKQVFQFPNIVEGSESFSIQFEQYSSSPFSIPKIKRIRKPKKLKKSKKSKKAKKENKPKKQIIKTEEEVDRLNQTQKSMSADELSKNVKPQHYESRLQNQMPEVKLEQ